MADRSASPGNVDRARRIAAKTQALQEARQQKKQQLISQAKEAQLEASDAGATLGVYHREISQILNPAQVVSQAISAMVDDAQNGQIGDGGLHEAAEAAAKHAAIAEGSEQLCLNKLAAARQQMSRILEAHTMVNAAAVSCRVLETAVPGTAKPVGVADRCTVHSCSVWSPECCTLPLSTGLRTHLQLTVS